MPENMGTYHLADNPKLYEPARSNNFEFVVTDVDRLLRAGVKESALAEESNYITNAQETLRVSVVASSVPHFTLGVLDVKRGNNTMHVAGTPTFDNHTLILNDFMGARTKSALLAWQAQAYDVRTEKVHRMDNYKHDCYLYEYSPDYDEVIRKWRMVGCWVSGLSEDNFNNEENNKRTITATIVYDKAIPMLPDEAE